MSTQACTMAPPELHAPWAPLAELAWGAGKLDLSAPSPGSVGVGWRQPHQRALFEEPAGLGFIEVHSENFFAPGGSALALLLRARAQMDVSLHGVGLALGSAVGLDAWHLDRLAALVERVQPCRVSDHACFARARLPGLGDAAGAGGEIVHGSDLLPIAFNAASLDLMVRHIQQVQERLRRPLLVENLSAYLQRDDSTWPEPTFFNELAKRSGCRLLLDLNNLVVNALNQGVPDPIHEACTWVDALAPGIVGEIHLAGYHQPAEPGELVIDDHGSAVRAGVWAVYRHALARLGPVPTLIEWDTEIPPWPVLLGEAAQAAHWLRQAQAERCTQGAL